MYFGRVVGSVWATVKNPAMTGCRMLVVQPLTPELQNTGKRLICTDCTGAGAGELVYWVRGKEASFPFLPAEPPVDTTVVGIVDEVHVKRTLPAAVGGSGRRQKRRRRCTARHRGRVEAMLIARVIGELVATQKHASHEGRKLLLVQPLNLDGTDRGDAVVAMDAVDAGVGDKVLLATEGFSAMTSVGRPNSPIDMAVIGFIDHIELVQGVN